MTDAVVTIAVPEQLVVDSPTAAVIEVPGAAVTVITTLDTPEILEVGMQGPPGPSGGGAGSASYTHTQAAAAATWVVNHNLGFRPAATVTTVGGVQVWAEVLHNSTNQLTVYFDSASTGQVTCS